LIRTSSGIDWNIIDEGIFTNSFKSRPDQLSQLPSALQSATA
jgi:hypothetical protein